SLNSSVPIGTMAAYGITAAVIWMSGWRMMFLLAGVVLFVISLVWLVGMGRVEAYAKEHGEKEVLPVSEAKRRSGDAGHDFQWKHVFIEAGFLLLMIALFVQGALKDGVTTWVPTYISETYGMSGVLAICTMSSRCLIWLVFIWLLLQTVTGSAMRSALLRHSLECAGQHCLCFGQLPVVVW
ncbi:MAG: MFS transporter, partial [Hungatella sp.]